MTDPTAVDTRKTIGRYEIRECVGRGGMGALFRGHDPVLDREVAIKTMLADFTGDEAGRTRFFREARAIARLQHRNIVTLFDFGEEDGTPYIVMEFLHGETLAERMKSHHGGRVPIDRVLDVGAQLCTGLHFAHARGVVHRDVKPPNIWLMEDGSVKVLDFGIAKFGDTAVTRVGGVVGSVSYMSPEQISGAEVDGRSDIFSVGIVLYELVSGKRPFVGDSPTAIMMRIVHEPPPQLDEPGVPPQLLALIERALQKDRSRRFQQAGELASDLRALQFSLSGPHRGARLPDHLQTTAPVGVGGAGWAGAGPAGLGSVGLGAAGLGAAGSGAAGAGSAGAGLAGAGSAGAGAAGLSSVGAGAAGAGMGAAGLGSAGSGGRANAGGGAAGAAAGAWSSSATALPPRAALASDAVQHAPGGWAMSNADELVADVVLNSSPSVRDAGVVPAAAARGRSKPAASSGFDWAKRWPALAVAGGAIAIASFVFVLLMRAEPATVSGGTTTGAAGSDSNAATHGNATPGNATPGHAPAGSATTGNATTGKAAGKTTGDVVANVGKNVAVAPVAGDPTVAGAPTSPNGGAAAAPATPAVDSNALHVVFTASYPFSVTDDNGNPLSASAQRHELSLAPKQVVRLRSSHYHLNQRVTIDGKPVRLPAPGFLSVRATRETCKLSLNGEAIGTPPVADLPVASGKYTLRLTCPDGDDDVSYVTVPPGESVLAKIQ